MLILHGTLFPMNFPAGAWFWLGISGIIGFAFGDLFLFKAFVEIGPRLSMLVMTLTAPISAGLGILFLGEHYTLMQLLGILVTLAGVGWVVMERPRGAGGSGGRKIRVITAGGILSAFLGTLGQATGYVLSKYGMQTADGYLDPFAATQVRVIAGTFGFIIVVLIRGALPQVKAALSNTSAMGFMCGGAFMGPFLGVSLSLLALHYTTTGVAATITALVPILIIPSVVFLGKEHVSARAFMGAVLAVGGVIILMLNV